MGLHRCHGRSQSRNKFDHLEDESAQTLRKAGLHGVRLGEDAQLGERVARVRVAPRRVAQRQEAIIHEGGHHRRTTAVRGSNNPFVSDSFVIFFKKSLP